MQTAEDTAKARLTVEDFKKVVEMANTKMAEVESSLESRLLTPEQVHESIVNHYSKLVGVFMDQVAGTSHPPAVDGIEETVDETIALS